MKVCFLKVCFFPEGIDVRATDNDYMTLRSHPFCVDWREVAYSEKSCVKPRIHITLYSSVVCIDFGNHNRPHRGQRVSSSRCSASERHSRRRKSGAADGDIDVWLFIEDDYNSSCSLPKSSEVINEGFNERARAALNETRITIPLLFIPQAYERHPTVEPKCVQDDS